MQTHILSTLRQSSVVRQLGGALGGALIAFVAYTGYREANTAIRAYLIPPGATRATFSAEVNMAGVESEQESADALRAASRAREIAAQLRANQERFNEVQTLKPIEMRAQEPVEDQTAEEVEPAIMMKAEKSIFTQSVPEADHETLHAGAPALPSSGVGLWIAGFVALAVSFMGTPSLRHAAARLMKSR